MLLKIAEMCILSIDINNRSLRRVKWSTNFVNLLVSCAFDKPKNGNALKLINLNLNALINRDKLKIKRYILRAIYTCISTVECRLNRL